MYRAGCRVLWFGIESGSKRILEKMRKDIDLDVAGDVLRRTYDVGIQVLTFWITNFPGEESSDVRRTIDFLKANGGHIDFAHFSEFHLHKGSAMYHRAEEYGIELAGEDVFGQPVASWAEKGRLSAKLMREVTAAFVHDRKLGWNFVGMV